MTDPSTYQGFTSPSSFNVPALPTGTSPLASFSAHTIQQEEQIKHTVYYLRKELGIMDHKLGYVYVTKQADTRFCKVGWTGNNPAARIRTIEKKCEVITEASHHIGPFFGAYRAERLLHCLLMHCRHVRKNCPCGCQNREWYKEDYLEVIRQADIVCSWLCRDPCPYGRVAQVNNLELGWEQALGRWIATQDREVPLRWDTFFLFGSSVNVVTDGPNLLSVYSSRSQLFGGEYLKEILSNIIQEVKENAIPSKARNRVEIRSADGSEDFNQAPDMPAPQLPHPDLQLKANLTIDLETVYDKPEGTPKEVTKATRQETWDHWFVAPDIYTSDGVMSEHIFVDKQATVSGPTSDTYIQRFPASIRTAEPPVIAQIFREGDSPSIDPPEERAGETWYYHQATIDTSERSATPEEEADRETADLGKQPHARDDDDVADILEMLARMPGAFPEDCSKSATIAEYTKSATTAEYAESTSSADMQMCLYQKPDVSYIFEDFFFCTTADGTISCEKMPDYNWKEIQMNRYDIPARRTFLVDDHNVVTWIPDIAPAMSELSSRVPSPVDVEAHFPPVADAPLCCKDLRVGSEEPNLPRDRVDEADSISPCSIFPGSVATSNSTSSASLNSPWRGNFSALSSTGTAVVPFVPPIDRENLWSGSPIAYQSITAMIWYRRSSFEELRLEDYNTGRRFVREQNPDAAEEESDCENLSSSSDDDRPRTRQGDLEEELQDLDDEECWYNYGLEDHGIEYESPQQRIRRLASDLGSMSSPSTENTPPPTWDDWLEEPSEDDSEDGSWADSHAEETVDEDEVDQCEHDANSTSTQMSPGHQHPPLPGSPCPAFDSPPHILLAAKSDPVGHSRLPTVQFTSLTFDQTHPFQSRTIPSLVLRPPYLSTSGSEKSKSGECLSVPTFQFPPLTIDRTGPFQFTSHVLDHTRTFQDRTIPPQPTESGTDQPEKSTPKPDTRTSSPTAPEAATDSDVIPSSSDDDDDNDDDGRTTRPKERLKRTKYADAPTTHQPHSAVVDGTAVAAPQPLARGDAQLGTAFRATEFLDLEWRWE